MVPNRPLLAAALAALLVGCAAAKPERLAYRTVQSAAMGRAMEYGVYTPPGFRPGEALPLVLFLHGGGDTARCLDQEGVSAWLDEEIAGGRVPRVLIAVPQGDLGFWANWADGTARYADWAVDEVVPAVAREFGARPCPDGCHLMGVSMGGAGVLRLALQDPGRWASAAIISGPTLSAAQMRALASDWRWRLFARLDRVFGSPDDAERRRAADPFQRWNGPEDLASLRVFVAHGDADRAGIAETNLALHQHLERRAVPHRYLVYRGGHRWADWEPVFAEALRAALK